MTEQGVAGRNGVVIRQPASKSDAQVSGYRTYEVYQRERVGQSTEKIKPAELISQAYRRDPYPIVAVLRENYPCYRDWLSNAYWVSRYDDVTSIFADDANFETRSNAWLLGLEQSGRDLGADANVAAALTEGFDTQLATVCDELLSPLRGAVEFDLVRAYTSRLQVFVLARLLGLQGAERDAFAVCCWRLQRGTSWQPELRRGALQAHAELIELFTRRFAGDVQGELLQAVAAASASNPAGAAADLVTTLLEMDHQSLPGTLANLWYLLLTHPQQLDRARRERRLMKLAYLETLRHSTPVVTARRYTRHEVERFGRLLPAGACVQCSAAGANRDPRIFADPEQFVVGRTDLCQREPRGQYRADGLASGIAFALGKPSIHPAVPEDRPRSRYALVRDCAVAASLQLLESVPEIRLAPGVTPLLASASVGEMHTCWRLPVVS